MNLVVDVSVFIDEIEYDLLLDIALSTACRAIDAYYIAVASIISSILVSADKIIVDNARKYGIEAYYIHGIKTITLSYQESAELYKLEQTFI